MNATVAGLYGGSDGARLRRRDDGRTVMVSPTFATHARRARSEPGEIVYKSSLVSKAVQNHIVPLLS